jgi:hypothetical protein
MNHSLHLTVITLLLGVSNLSAVTHYVSLESTNPTPPYTNWATAATDIQHAVDVADPSDEIVVTNGVYASGGRAVGTDVLLNRVALNKPLTLCSVNGPEVTIIQGYQVPGTTNGDGAIRCVYLDNGASLSGFTLTNGATRAVYDSHPFRESSGGGLRCEATNAVVSNCVIIGNSAHTGGGGGVYGATLNNCTLTGNSALFGGGADSGTLNNCVLTGNSADAGGGAMNCSLNNCTLTGNSADWWGGGAYECTLYACTLRSNSTSEYGAGAIYCSLINCTLSSNYSGHFGGGAYNSTLNNCTLTGNSATGDYGLGGGAYGCTLNNCTLTGNYAGNWGLGNGAVTECRLVNCIVYFNTGNGFPGPNFGNGTFEHCCTTPLPTDGVGNIANAPLFVNYAAGDFRLGPDSPCIDAGTNLAGLLTTDLLGLPRLMDGNDDGIARVDMGAYEFNPYRFAPTLHLSANGFQFTVRGEPGQSIRIERSRDLGNWEFACEVPIPACGQTLIDPAATSESKLFYRAIRVPAH